MNNDTDAPATRKVGEFVITKNRPIPPSRRKTSYPFDQLEVGESFVVPCEKEKRKTKAANVSQSGERFRNSDPQYANRRFHVSGTAEENGVVCWRVEDDDGTEDEQ
jgi:hypothetical protein